MAGAAGLTAFYRVEIPTRKIEVVASIENVEAVIGVLGIPWSGVSPDGAPLIAREARTQEICALDVDLP